MLKPSKKDTREGAIKGGGGGWGSLALNENYGRRDLTVPFKLV